MTKRQGHMIVDSTPHFPFSPTLDDVRRESVDAQTEAEHVLSPSIVPPSGAESRTPVSFPGRVMEQVPSRNRGR